jgi:2-dehydro-3-deoxygluconokinase
VSKSRSVWETLRENQLIALLAPRSTGECIAIYEALHPLGVVLEIGLRSEVALAGIAAVCQRHPQAGVLAGTVMTGAQAEAAIAAGAAGVVSADYIPAVVAACAERDIMCIPGGLGDVGKQLSQKADLYNCDLPTLRERHPYQWIYKLFPALAGSCQHVDLVAPWRAIYPGLAIVYTGGVSARNLSAIMRADPGGIICASALTRGAEDPAAVGAEAERWLTLMRAPAGPTGPAQEETGDDTGPARPARDAGIVTFGEIMLRLSPPHGERLVQATRLDACFGGAAANVAVSLARFGWRSRFVTVLPDQALGQAAIDSLRAHGVDTEQIARAGRRLGVYYLEGGAAQRPARVLYDRAGSAFSEVRPGQIDWEAAFANANWFHWTGITPALSETAAAAIREALAAAKRCRLGVSVDINYRSRLWSREAARAVMVPLMDYVDVAVGNEADMADVFGIQAGRSDPSAGVLDVEGYRGVAGEMIGRFGLRMMAITLRESRSASDNTWSACLCDGRDFHQSRSYDIRVVDRVGAGDAFAAGLIHGILSGMELPAMLEFATAAGCLKHSIRGDFNQVTADEVASLAAGAGAGRVQR